MDLINLKTMITNNYLTSQKGKIKQNQKKKKASATPKGEVDLSFE